MKNQTKIENCLNCEMDGQCYECYILSGDEDREIARIAKHKELYEKIWCNYFESFDGYMANVNAALGYHEEK
jgi:hypothetical protein